MTNAYKHWTRHRPHHSSLKLVRYKLEVSRGREVPDLQWEKLRVGKLSMYVPHPSPMFGHCKRYRTGLTKTWRDSENGKSACPVWQTGQADETRRQDLENGPSVSSQPRSSANTNAAVASYPAEDFCKHFTALCIAHPAWSCAPNSR